MEAFLLFAGLSSVKLCLSFLFVRVQLSVVGASLPLAPSARGVTGVEGVERLHVFNELQSPAGFWPEAEFGAGIINNR